VKKTYWQKLKEHPGSPMAAIMSIGGTIAGAGNESFPTLFHGALFGFCVSLSVWAVVLWTARTQL
jgi:hypothetical protein